MHVAHCGAAGAAHDMFDLQLVGHQPERISACKMLGSAIVHEHYRKFHTLNRTNGRSEQHQFLCLTLTKGEAVHERLCLEWELTSRALDGFQWSSLTHRLTWATRSEPSRPASNYGEADILKT